MAKLKKKNAPRGQNLSVVAPVSVANTSGAVSSLDDAQKGVISNAEGKLRDLKLLVADLTMEEVTIQARKNKALQLIQEAQQALLDSVRDIAQAHGINPDGDPADGRWTLNTSTMQFTKQ